MTIHLITVADVLDKYIGQGCRIDQERMHALMQEVSSKTKMPLNAQNLSQDDFKAEVIMGAVASLEVRSSDAVVFYYSGHGHRSDSKESKWPHFSMGWTPSNKKLLSLDAERIFNELRNKDPRMLMMVVDACNVFRRDCEIQEVGLRAAAEQVSPYEVENYRSLFKSFKGSVLAMAAQPGEFAIANDSGGYFSNALLSSINKAVKEPDAAWGPILEEASMPLPVPNKLTGFQTPVFCVLSSFSGVRWHKNSLAKAFCFADLSSESQKELVKSARRELHLAGHECVVVDDHDTGNAASSNAFAAYRVAAADSETMRDTHSELPFLVLCGLRIPTAAIKKLVISGYSVFFESEEFKRLTFGARSGKGSPAPEVFSPAGAGGVIPPPADGSLQGSVPGEQYHGAVSPPAATGPTARDDSGEGCPKCAENRQMGLRFCDRCGASLVLGQEAPRFCSSCGVLMENGQLFCQKCGTKASGGGPLKMGAGETRDIGPTSGLGANWDRRSGLRESENWLDDRMKALKARLNDKLEGFNKKIKR